jgi:hypothetical protein
MKIWIAIGEIYWLSFPNSVQLRASKMLSIVDPNPKTAHDTGSQVTKRGTDVSSSDIADGIGDG